MFHRRHFFLSVLILIVALTLMAVSTLAQDTAPDPPSDPAALPFGGNDQDLPSFPRHVDKLGDWSMLAYQKLQQGNWEIYVDGQSGSRRLTYHPANDQQPSLDRGTRRVAFVSDRTGDFDLYMVGTDGQGFRRLLDTPSTIAFPAWSPDGKRLAVQVRVGPQYEIFLVNVADGSQQRLTNHAAFDGMPAWSPDGQRIAFASNRSGDYRIHVMNADGTGQRPLSSFPNSLHPTWSPDGRSIAFDADIDGDGWQELALIDATGRNQRLVFEPGLNKTAWAGGWAPDKSAIGFTEITAELQNGNWVWIRGVLRQWNDADGARDLVPGGREWYMDWESADDRAPETTIDKLAAYTKAEDFVLRWQGSDAGGSGIKSYAVYYNRKDGRGWQTLLSPTTATETPFAAQPGQTVRFLVRATDNAFNSGTWPQQMRQQTTFYRTKVSGTVRDNRGNPLSDVLLETKPALSTAPVVANWQGVFSGYAFQENDFALSFSEPNFQDSPETFVPDGADFQRNFYLRPADDRIKNGTFESDPNSPVDWITAGNLPSAVSDEDPATGRYALRIGPATLPQGQLSTQASATGSVSQNVTIPAQMQGPTLSYMLRTAGEPVGGNSGLRVRIQAVGQREPAAITAPAADDWDQHWIDMTPWQGQQVSLTFELLQSAEDPLQAVFLDDISLGSSHPDLWVALATPTTEAVPEETVSYTLDYGNRGPITAANSVVELALPPEISLISATPPYTFTNNVLRWDVGDLPPHGPSRRLNIDVTPVANNGQVVALTSLIFTSTPEAHQGNNTTETKMRLIKHVFYPLITIN